MHEGAIVVPADYIDNNKDLSQGRKKMTVNYCNYEKEEYAST